MDIIYYSNYCKHCQKLINTLVKGNVYEKISFICIDKRNIDIKTNQTYIVLENGSKVVLPPNIHSVPSLLLVNKNYKVILGDDIIKHYHSEIKTLTEKAIQFNGEPSGYMLGISVGGTNIISENYTMYNMTSDELSAKGKGNNRQMYNYVSANDEITLIPTPAETYKPDKLSNSVTIDTLQQKRIDEIR
jgi:hypothetical protein